MKKVLTMVLALVMVFSLLTGCGSNSAVDTESSSTSDSGSENAAEPADSNDDSTEADEFNDDTDSAAAESDVNTDSEADEAEVSEETPKPPASADLSSEWSSYQFQLEDKIYTLPIRYSDLEADGWSIKYEGNKEESIKAGSYILNYITLTCSNKENAEIEVQFANLDDKDMQITDCYVASVQYWEHSSNKDTVIYFPGGLTLGSTKEEVAALYGEPNEINSFSNTDKWKYEIQNYDDVTLTINKDTGIIEQIEMANMYLP